MVQRLVRPVVIGGTRAPPAPTTQLGAAPPRTTLGTGLARTGTNTGTLREPEAAPKLSVASPFSFASRCLYPGWTLQVQLVEPPFARTTLQDKRKSPKLGLPGGRTHTSPPLCPDTAKPPKIFLQAEGGYIPKMHPDRGCCSQMQPRSTFTYDCRDQSPVQCVSARNLPLVRAGVLQPATAKHNYVRPRQHALNRSRHSPRRPVRSQDRARHRQIRPLPGLRLRGPLLVGHGGKGSLYWNTPPIMA